MTSPSIPTPGWRELAFSDAVLVNPSEVRLSRGDTYPFVDMASVVPMATASRRWRLSNANSKEADRDFNVVMSLMARITPCLENGKIRPIRADGQRWRGSWLNLEFIVIRGRPRSIRHRLFLLPDQVGRCASIRHLPDDRHVWTPACSD